MSSTKEVNTPEVGREAALSLSMLATGDKHSSRLFNSQHQSSSQSRRHSPPSSSSRYDYFEECPNLQCDVLDFFRERQVNVIIQQIRSKLHHVDQERMEIEERCDYVLDYIQMMYQSLQQHHDKYYTTNHSDNSGMHTASIQQTPRDTKEMNVTVQDTKDDTIFSFHPHMNKDRTYEMYCNSITNELQVFFDMISIRLHDLWKQYQTHLTQRYSQLSMSLSNASIHFSMSSSGNKMNRSTAPLSSSSSTGHSTACFNDNFEYKLIPNVTFALECFQQIIELVDLFPRFITMTSFAQPSTSSFGNSSRKRHSSKNSSKHEDLFIKLITSCIIGIQFLTLALSLSTSKNILLSNYLIHEAQYCFITALQILTSLEHIPVASSPRRRKEVKAKQARTEGNYRKLMNWYEGDSHGNSLLYASYQCYVCLKLQHRDLLNLWVKFMDALDQEVHHLKHQQEHNKQVIIVNNSQPQSTDEEEEDSDDARDKEEDCKEMIFQYNQAIVHFQLALNLSSNQHENQTIIVDAFRKCAIACEKNADALQDHNLIASQYYLAISEAYRAAGRSFLYASKEEGREEREVLHQSGQLFLQKVQKLESDEDESVAYYLGKAAHCLIHAFYAYQAARQASSPHEVDVQRVWFKVAHCCREESQAIVEGRLEAAMMYHQARTFLGSTSKTAKHYVDTAAKVYQRLADSVMSITTSKKKQHGSPITSEAQRYVWKQYALYTERCGMSLLQSDVLHAKQYECAIIFLHAPVNTESQVHPRNTSQGAIGCIRHQQFCAQQQLPFISHVEEMWSQLSEMFLACGQSMAELNLDHALQENTDSSLNDLKAWSNLLLSLLSNEKDPYVSAYGLLERIEEEIVEYGSQPSMRLSKHITPHDMKELVDLTKAYLYTTCDVIRILLQAFLSSPTIVLPDVQALVGEETMELLHAYQLTLHAIFRVHNINRDISFSCDDPKLLEECIGSWKKSKSFGKQWISCLSLKQGKDRVVRGRLQMLCRLYGGLPSEANGVGYFLDRYFAIQAEEERDASSPNHNDSSSIFSLTNQSHQSHHDFKSLSRQQACQSLIKKAHDLAKELKVMERL